MPSVYRVTAVWNGFQGAPGYSKFSFQALNTDVNRNAAGAAVRAWFASLTSYMQNAWTVAVQPTVQEFNDLNGLLIGEDVMTTVPASVGGIGGSGAFAGGSGACVSWKTTFFFVGRRVQGRTFLVPLLGAFDTDGTLAGSIIGTLNTANAALIAAPNAELAVWAKQWSAPDSSGHRTQISGVTAPVTSAVVKDMASQLRSRRT